MFYGEKEEDLKKASGKFTFYYKAIMTESKKYGIINRYVEDIF